MYVDGYEWMHGWCVYVLFQLLMAKRTNMKDFFRY